VICSRNLVPGPVSKIRFSTVILQNTTNFGLYLHLFTMLNSIVALVYFPLHIHKLCRLITRRALVSETTNIISCDARPRKLWFSLLTFVTYLGQTDFQTGSGYSGNAANHYKQAERYAEQNLRHCGLSTVCCMDQRFLTFPISIRIANDVPSLCHDRQR